MVTGERPQIVGWAGAINARQRRVAVRWPNIDETVVRGPRATKARRALAAPSKRGHWLLLRGRDGEADEVRPLRDGGSNDMGHLHE